MLTAIPTEQTTAFTDILLVVAALLAARYLWRFSERNAWKTTLWVWVFNLLAVAALLGAIAHGLALVPGLQNLLWIPLNLALALTVAIFLVATINDIKGEAWSRRSLPFLLLIGVLFFVSTLVWPDDYMLFIIYKVSIMLLALSGYLWLTLQHKLVGAAWMASGVLLTIIAAAIQASASLTINIIWQFDHNGIYHLLQLLAIGLLMIGLRKDLFSE